MVKASDELQISKLLSKYQYCSLEVTKKDVIDVLNYYGGLTYSGESFVFNDGNSRDLFNLHGTIPVCYKNNTYNIPVCIWLMDTHPNNAPMCYVRPTSEMRIKVSMYVDHNGKIYLPYLHDWQPNSSDLLGLIQVMIITFGESPPVYAKPKENTVPYPTNSYMPQPGASPFLPYPQPAGGGGGGGGGGSGSFPPYPTSNFGGFPPYPPVPGSGAPGPTPAGSGYPPYMQSYPPASGYNANFPSSNNQGTGTITEEHIKASLISAIEDKMRRKISERVNQFQAEIQTLKRTKQELTEGRSKINELFSKWEREEAELKKNIAVLTDKEQELEKSLESLDQVNGIDVDEAVTTTAPLYRQLLNAYAEEAATEDTIYYLGEALRAGVIDLEVFLKHVRQLSRKQFMLRAIMQKCRQKAGLVG